MFRFILRFNHCCLVFLHIDHCLVFFVFTAARRSFLGARVLRFWGSFSSILGAHLLLLVALFFTNQGVTGQSSSLFVSLIQLSDNKLSYIIKKFEDSQLTGKMEEKLSTTPKSFIDQSVVPGDVVLDVSTMGGQTIKLGGGLCQDVDAITVTKVGKLRFAKPNKYWVEGSQKRYVPCVEDLVLGIVVDCRAENFLVDIKGSTLAFLPVLAFEGVIRRNIPRFEVGTLLYARVVKANAGMNLELSCIDANGKAAEFGPLKEGFMFETSTGLSRMLLSSPTCPVLEGLGKKLCFETAVGLNGRVWVNAESSATVILVSNAIMKAETLSAAQQKIMVDKLLQRVQ